MITNMFICVQLIWTSEKFLQLYQLDVHYWRTFAINSYQMEEIYIQKH